MVYPGPFYLRCAIYRSGLLNIQGFPYVSAGVSPDNVSKIENLADPLDLTCCPNGLSMNGFLC
jgi:hypothetical protein